MISHGVTCEVVTAYVQCFYSCVNEVCSRKVMSLYTCVILFTGGGRSLTQGVICHRGVSVQGVSVQGGLCPRGVSVQGQKLWEGNIFTPLCHYVHSWDPGDLCPGGSLSKGVSVQGGLCQGGTEVSVSACITGHMTRGVSVQGALCPGGVSVQWFFVQGGLCLGGLCPEGLYPGGISVRETPYVQ